jgi:hypothetical protein
MTSTSDEKGALLRRLEAQRRHVLGIIDGLPEDALRRPVLPSGWHCLGLVRHLALSDEHYWFRCVVAGEPQDYLPDEPNADWQVAAEDSADSVLELYRDEIARSNAIIAATALDEAPAWTDPHWAQWGMDFPDLRTIMLHVLVETAVHAGHADAVRELIDGRQWIVL